MDTPSHIDEARAHLDHDIARAKNTRKMLTHLAEVVRHGPRGGTRDPHFPEEAIDALLHGSDLAQDRWENLIHCSVIYDAKKNTPVEDPAEDRVG